jgi:hypothetical protein
METLLGPIVGIICILGVLFTVWILGATEETDSSKVNSQVPFSINQQPSETSNNPKKKRQFLPQEDWFFIKKWSVLIGIVLLALMYLPPIKVEIVHSSNGNIQLKTDDVKVKLETGYTPVQVRIENKPY